MQIVGVIAKEEKKQMLYTAKIALVGMQYREFYTRYLLEGVL